MRKLSYSPNIRMQQSCGMSSLEFIERQSHGETHPCGNTPPGDVKLITRGSHGVRVRHPDSVIRS